MRPDRFAQLLTAAANSLDGVTAELTPETDGRHLRPYVVTVQAGGKTTRWQVTAASAPGDKYSEPEAEPILGEKPEPPAAMTMPAGSLEQLEAALVTAVLDADAGEIAAADLYSRRPAPPAVGYGATIVCHNGAKIFLNKA
jgi:hypothetical protein